MVLSTPLVRQPGVKSEYSDLGLDVVGFAIERIAGQPLDRFVRRAVYDKLGIDRDTPLYTATNRPVFFGHLGRPMVEVF